MGHSYSVKTCRAQDDELLDQPRSMARNPGALHDELPLGARNCLDDNRRAESDRMPSSAPKKKNEDPVLTGDLFLSVQKMIHDARERHDEPRGSVQPSAPCIFKVPDKLRELKPSAYTPRVMSIGPLHKHDKHLREDMKGHKMSYMLSLFLRTSSSVETVADVEATPEYKCFNAMLKIVDRARACYDKSTQGLCDMDNVNFAEMLLLDGCFLLEFFYQEFYGDAKISNVLLHYDIIHDLVLLENQIPLFVLEVLFECTLKRIEGNSSSLTGMVHYFFESLNIVKDIQTKAKDTPASNRHILDLLHSRYRPSSAQQDNNRKNERISKHSATELGRTGVKLLADSPKKIPRVSANALQPNLTESESTSWPIRRKKTPSPPRVRTT
ncbi:hypothetical protein RJ640_018335 [Escallonia rubra]|uniref:Uncharacterized protein n=1 Tax=Escallonia rubra TaxID=112253 RepID=A0AA88R6J7_9ASTE|nr:hypothetical protein RJ640_018335 [Escallonia rubra]